MNYEEKLSEHIPKTNYNHLPLETQLFIKEKALQYEFSFQELKQLIDFAIDFVMWHEEDIQKVFKADYPNRKVAFNDIRSVWERLKKQPNSYKNFSKALYKDDIRKFSFTSFEGEKTALGACPVASPKTRCCNLLTLDAVQSCGFDCSYCSIQSFYNQDKIGFDSNFKENLKNLQLDPNETYHIGTGQSSDSLMWGNKEGILDALFEFAFDHPNVILEFKTKSNNIKYFLENDVPKNIICTWSLNTPTIIENEEHLAASLEQRLDAAQKLSQKGVLVGFHFHPIVHYENYLEEYGKVYQSLIESFDAKKVALVSFGTLTFIKPVIQKIRSRNFKSKILQMPFIDANGKQSYPLEIKKEMFKHAYDSFAPWHKEVYFYLCMEDESLWRETFGYEYISNNQMEEFMKLSYQNKIEQNRNYCSKNRK
ncbi:MAG: radical SAM protein [Candidatus Marinarcus sp.]|uniref:SPL family radical SAM protein n=1 Tax=Candidatus Marinarcus sp. TaxID=3100987 RepID=UPI003B006836